MYRAIEKAKVGIAKGQTPFGACLVKSGKAIACSHNSVWRSTDITAHAEINVIRKACKKLRTIDLSDTVLYSTCEPCPMCFSACHWAKISRVIYGARMKDAKELGFNELFISAKKMRQTGKSPLAVTGDFLRQENLGLFKIWARQKNKRVY
jgi:guanine deaminase